MMIFVGIGNSDNKLTQREWAGFVGEVEALVTNTAEQVHGAWFSRPDAPWQNACWCFEAHLARAEQLKPMLAEAGESYRQDSIAWSEAVTEFLPGSRHLRQRDQIAACPKKAN